MVFTWLFCDRLFSKRSRSARSKSRPITRGRLGLEALETRLAPAQLLNASTLL